MGPDADWNTLFECAAAVARERVVLKQPAFAEVSAVLLLLVCLLVCVIDIFDMLAGTARQFGPNAFS